MRGETNTVLVGFALGWGLWLLIVTVALIEGVTDRLFSMSVAGGHARLLVIPLFFICESWVTPRMAAFVGSIARSGVVPAGERLALDAEVSRTRRWTNRWWPEAFCLLVAIVLGVTGVRLQTYGETGGFDSARTSVTFLLYLQVGLTLFRFLLFRWAWKLALWCWFLWRVSRLRLHLIPGHPDRAGGLNTLEGVHERFTPLVVALSVLECASLAESISTGTLAVRAIYPTADLVGCWRDHHEHSGSNHLDFVRFDSARDRSDTAGTRTHVDGVGADFDVAHLVRIHNLQILPVPAGLR